MRSAFCYPCLGLLVVLLSIIERSCSQLQLQTFKKPFYVNCDEENITDVSECKNHIREALIDYVEAGEYSPNELPVTSDFSGPLDVETWMTFASIDEVAELEGTMSITVYLDMIWYDQFLTWNSSVCLGVENLYVDFSLVYVPDLYLYNAVGEYTKMMSVGQVDWHSSGAMWYSRVGGLTFACDYDLKEFPADKQTCTMRFGSLLYYSDLLTFSTPSSFMADDAPMNQSTVEIQESFRSSAWNVKKVTGESAIEYLYDTEYSFMYYTVEIKRYPQYYFATAVIPETVVCIIAILGFWVSDLVARLTLSITALLTTMTIQWSVSAELPVSREFTWMSRYSVVVIVLIALCVAETCGIAYMRLKTGLVPHWVQFMIAASHNCRKMYRVVTCHCGMGAVTVKRRNTHAVMTHQAGMVKLKANSPKHEKTEKTANTATVYPIVGDGNLKELPQRAQEIEMTNLAEVNGVEEDNEEEGLIGSQSLKVRDITHLDELLPLFKFNHWNSGKKAIDLTWDHGAAALDDVSSVIFPVVYIIILITMIFANTELMEGI